MSQHERFSTRPLYLQVKDALADRIARREWLPGASLPNEVELSRQLEVSQGTVRKALGELENEHLVTRRQGRGTFVNDLATADAASRFSHLRGAGDRCITSSISHNQVKVELANEQECARLKLHSGEHVIRIRRIRAIDRKPFMLEDIAMPASRFPGSERQVNTPQKISALAQQFGLLLGAAEERISVAGANHDVADALSVAPHTPLMHLDRVIHLMDGPPIQWRIAHCHLQDQYYLVVMGGNGRKRKY